MYAKSDPNPAPVPRRTPLRRRAAAAYLNVGDRTLEKWARTGQGPLFIKAGSLALYDPDDLDAWLEERKRTSTSDSGPATP